MPPLVGLLQGTAGGTASDRSDRSVASATGAPVGIAQGGVPLQLVYHVLLVVWQLTFDETVAEEIVRIPHRQTTAYDIIPPILDNNLRSPIKEK